jgi:hypothetical protein
MNGVVEVPGPSEIQDSPQNAILGVLEHALLVAGTSLMVEHPAIGRVSECYEGRVPPRQTLLAQLIVDRCTELGDLIGWYRRSCRRVLTDPMDRDDIAEGLPF